MIRFGEDANFSQYAVWRRLGPGMNNLDGTQRRGQCPRWQTLRKAYARVSAY